MEHYAKTLLSSGVSFKSGQILSVKVPVEALEFGRILSKEAYKMGAKFVNIEYTDSYEEKQRLKYSKEEYLDFYPDFKADFEISLATEGACFIRLLANDFSSDFDPIKMEKLNKAKLFTMKKHKPYTGSGNACVCNARVPTLSWAKKVFPNESDPLKKLWDTLYKIIKNDNEDFKENIEKITKRRDFLTKTQFKSLEFKSKSVDFSLDLPKNHEWSGGCEVALDGRTYMPNLPTAEVFTAPKKYSLNGILKNSKPLVINSSIIDDFMLEFKDGKIIKAFANVGDDALQRLIATDDGSCYIGEVALVSEKSLVANTDVLFYDTMFDENASCHLAIGKAYSCSISDKISDTLEDYKKYELNFSSVHCDFMFGSNDLTVVATNEKGEKIKIFENGDFII